MSNTILNLPDECARCGNCGEVIHLVYNYVWNAAFSVDRLASVYWGHSEYGGHMDCPLLSDVSKRCPDGRKFDKFRIGAYSRRATVENKSGNDFVRPWLRSGFGEAVSE